MTGIGQQGQRMRQPAARGFDDGECGSDRQRPEHAPFWQGAVQFGRMIVAPVRVTVGVFMVMGVRHGAWYRSRMREFRCNAIIRRFLASRTTHLAESKALVGIIMGSRSDWETLTHAAQTLEQLGIPHEAKVVSAHRTPDRLFEYASSAKSRGIKVIIAGAGGAAHLPGMTASKTELPVLGVPVRSQALEGLDSLLSIVQMPAGVPVGTLAIGKAGAVNAALLAASILALGDAKLAKRLQQFRADQTQAVLKNADLP